MHSACAWSYEQAGGIETNPDAVYLHPRADAAMRALEVYRNKLENGMPYVAHCEYHTNLRLALWSFTLLLQMQVNFFKLDNSEIDAFVGTWCSGVTSLSALLSPIVTVVLYCNANDISVAKAP